MAVSSNIVLTQDRLKREVDYFLHQPRFVFDIESMGEHRGVPQQNQVVWLAMATYGRSIVIPMGHPNGDIMLEKPKRRKNQETKKFEVFPAKWSDPPEQLRPSQVFGALEPLFFDEKIEKGAHNAPFDFISVTKYFGGEIPKGPYHDTIVLSWLVNENRRLGLKDITKARYKRAYDAENVGRKIEIHPFWKVGQYAYLDGKFTWLHLLDLMEEIEVQNLTHVYGLEMEILQVLLHMETEGIHVDVEKMEELRETLTIRRTQSEGKVYRAAGTKFNLNSPKQKVDILYGDKKDGGQGLRPWRLTKGGRKKDKDGQELTKYDYSTDAESLEKFVGNPLVDAILEFQEVDRVLGTYIEGYLGKDDKPSKIFDGRVYPEFVQYGTVTGRFSCRAPNLQNIPRPDTDLGKAVRGLFIGGPGHKLVVADYGQIELVVLAHFVGYGALFDGFHQGIDPHTMTAAMVFAQDPEDLQRRVEQGDPEAKGWRQIAKNLNFAIVYGAGPAKVASMSKVSERKAKQFLATHEQEFPEIYKFKDQALRTCRSRRPPNLRTLEGRMRRLPSIHSRDYGIKGKAERQAINSLIQGSAADLIKVAMVRTHEALRKEDTGRLLLTVHDELVTRATEENAERAAALMREAMTGPGIQQMVKVPLTIDLKIVDRWADAK